MSELKQNLLAITEGHSKKEICEVLLQMLNETLGFEDFMELIKFHHFPYELRQQKS